MADSPVGVINLECLMNRANIFFTSGYRFHGNLDIERFKASFFAIADCIEKFEHRLDFRAQDDFRWVAVGNYKKHFQLVESDDLDAAFGALCRDSLSLVDEDNHCPMALTVIRNQLNTNDFIIAQTSEHTYLDARSAEVLFNRIVDYYNALTSNDAARLEDILATTRRIRTMSSAEMVDLLAVDGHDREANIAGLTTYPIADAGAYAIPLETVPYCLENYRKQRVAPIVRFFDLRSLMDRCRAKYPEVTQNSVACAALCKGFYTLNRAEKNQPEKHLVSFKMLSDLLSPELREQYSGNYIAFVPVSVEGDKPIEELAKDIHDRIRHFKTSKLDVTIFKLTEEAVEQALVGQANDPLSFVVTNWNNYRFLSNREFLAGCESVRHQSGVNIDPRDTLGAVLVNRPILVINLSPNGELCLSFFPSLRADKETLEVAEHISSAISPPAV